jgi:hypothetical protein
VELFLGGPGDDHSGRPCAGFVQRSDWLAPAEALALGIAQFQWERQRGDHEGVAVKVPVGGAPVAFAGGVDEPRHLTFGRSDDLFLADEYERVVIRFRAPALPVLTLAPDEATRLDPSRYAGQSLRRRRCRPAVESRSRGR